MHQDVDGTFGVRVENGVGIFGAAIHLGSEMNDDVIFCRDGTVGFVKDVPARTPRQIIGAEMPDKMSAQIAAAACDENFHNSIKGDKLLDSKGCVSIEF